MKRFEIFFGIIKIPVDLVMTILGFFFAYQLRLITEPIPGIAKPIETFPFSRLAIFYSGILTLFFIILGRTLIKFIQFILLKKGIGRRRLAIIGNNSITKEIYNYLEHNIHYKILGLIANDNENTIKHLGPISNFPEILKRIKPDEVIQTKSDLTETQNEDILEFCELNHINYRFIPDLLDVRRTNIEIETISGIPIISLKPTPLDGWGKVYKRTVDIIGSTLGMIILSPVLLLTAIAIKIDSRGPVLFSKLDNDTPAVRVGQHGRLFKFYKFRSMHHNTHDLRAKLADNNLRSDGPLMKIKNDPRITRVGKFLRRSSIDELPQLWNIFLGNMSLVGPRPHLPEEVEKYQQHHRFVLTIKPGLSGLPQISGRSGLSFEEEVKLDRFYIENWSIWLDIKIILKTLYIVLRGYQE
ncbi:sugar transferase [Candidatus Peregrinibacteria bacterium]|nr:sugar transferase [Candidatus Peregrinibacteria bacterium]